MCIQLVGDVQLAGGWACKLLNMLQQAETGAGIETGTGTGTGEVTQTG